MFANCIDNVTGTSSKVKTVDSPLLDVETVTQNQRNLPFFGASIDRSIYIGTPAQDPLSCFDGMIVTNIDYTEEPTPTRPNRVTFSSSTLGGYDGVRMKAIFINNLRSLDGDKMRRFEGDQMSVDEAYDFFNKEYPEATPLFFIHGYNNEPADTFEAVSKAQTRFNEKAFPYVPWDQKDKKKWPHVIVPVIWPCEWGFTNYHEDRHDNAPEAADELGMAFGSVLKTTNKFPKKNLLCHSMGNYVMRKAAGKLQGVQFDNIIMVSADLRHNLFDTKFIDSGSKDGLYIFGLLKKNNDKKPVGKIYVAYNGWDYALEQSTGIGGNWVTRMGTVGVGTYDHYWYGWADDKNLLHPDIRDHFENYNAGAELSWKDMKSHSYQWMDFMIDFYKSKLD